ncbi:hypothetical protein GH714_034603 [Hevea brasiliensis]|uniref:Protein kinase domain-containing protein n=1 Tax=Hevea brasiliensis TaxID=3981 RepID=A0A6A6M2V4_HEVBR|nr:hypothetical protein GH714_034603 [Hevea brasiliensis]
MPFQYQQSSSSTAAASNSSSLFQNLLDSEASDPQLHSSLENPSIGDIDVDEKDSILVKTSSEVIPANPLSPTLSEKQQNLEIAKDTFGTDEVNIEKATVFGTQKSQNYVSQSAVALRCFFSAVVGGAGLSRYHTDFHEIQQIGSGSFSRAFKVLKRIDGCMYAVKCSTRQLHQDSERRKALMEVQALAAIGYHENIVGYYSSWFENEQLYIQMELCDCSLSINKSSKSFTEDKVLEVLHQIAKALQFIHERGIAHLDSLPIEEGDARYMPQEILNEDYNHLDKVDIFSFGAAIYELIRGLPLSQSGSQFFNLREGRLPILPGHSLQFQNLLKAMLDPDAVRRPSAKEILESSIFDKLQRKLNQVKS